MLDPISWWAFSEDSARCQISSPLEDILLVRSGGSTLWGDDVKWGLGWFF